MASRNILAATVVGMAATAQPLYSALTHPGCANLAASDFKEVVLVARGNPSGAPTALVTDGTMLEPVGLYVHADGKVYWTERANSGSSASATSTGRLRMFNPANNTVKTLATFQVSTSVVTGQVGNREYGLRFFTLDPNYAQNKWGYVVYTPRTTASGRQVDTMLVSRFTLPSLDSIDMSSEKKLIKMPWTPGICCHQGGAMDWDADGNLYITTGNNVENSDNFGPMDDSLFADASGDPKDRATRDNQARVANTMDWRGKILRIKPDSSERGYRIPAGNFRQRYLELGGTWVAGQDTNKILPELYTVGHRNPYSLFVDKVKGWVAWGEVGPDAGSASGTRGPAGRDEFNLATKPGFFGWPYFVGDNQAYNMWNPATKSYGLPKQKPDSVYNNSPHNTGVSRLPTAQPAILPESKNTADNTRFNLGSGSGTTAVTGPIYRYDGALASTKKLPPHFDGKWIIAEGIKHWVKVATLNDSGTAVTALDDFPGAGSVIRPAGQTNGIEGMALGPEGALYILHYAGPYFGSSASTRISRIEYQGNCLPATPILPGSMTGARRDRLMNGVFFVPGGAADIAWPEGMTRVEAFDLQGKRLFHAARAEGATRVDMPGALRGSLVRVRFSP
jgi:cytochrome c